MGDEYKPNIDQMLLKLVGPNMPEYRYPTK